jgi:alpha/beta hydrolase fold
MARASAEDVRDVLPRVDVPTLLVYGERDVRAPLTVAEDLEAAIPGSRLVVLPDAGHLCNIEAPNEFNVAVRDSSTRAAGRCQNPAKDARRHLDRCRSSFAARSWRPARAPISLLAGLPPSRPPRRHCPGPYPPTPARASASFGVGVEANLVDRDFRRSDEHFAERCHQLCGLRKCS